MEPQSLLLLDLDSVLVHPVGYQEALRATVDHFGRLMGQARPVRPGYEDIIASETSGFTNEWDTAAISVASLVLAALEEAPHLARETLADTLAAIREGGVQIEPPDFTWLTREVSARYRGPRPSRVALDILLESAPQPTHNALHELLAEVYQLDAPTTRVFQHHTIGSRRFVETYGRNPDFDTASLLATMDCPLLDAEMRERLLRSVAEGSRHAAIYTARPSLPPVDVHEECPLPLLEIAPEAEIARELVGLEELPLIATGRMVWLAARDGARPEDYVKPSPVHALAAMGAALSGSETPALEAALAFTECGEVSGPLVRLKDAPTRVTVFEDTVGGIQSASTAVDLLREAGLDVTLEAVGVSPEGVKREALARVASHLVNDVNEGLYPILVD